MASLLSDLEERLKSGSWILLRKSKHQVWLHPVTRQTMTIPLRVKDTPRRRANYMGTIQRYEQTPRAELIDNAATAKPEIPKVDLRKVAAGASAAVRQTTEVIRRIDQGAKKEPDFADYLYGFIKQKEGGAAWWTLFSTIRSKAKLGREELSRKVGFRWSPATVRALEAGKLPGLPEQELVALMTALGAPEKVIVAMLESRLVPTTHTPTVPEVSAVVAPAPAPVESNPSKFRLAVGMPKTPYQLPKEKRRLSSVLRSFGRRLLGLPGRLRGTLLRLLLGSSRITNDEANTLLNGLENGFLDLLLKL